MCVCLRALFSILVCIYMRPVLKQHVCVCKSLSLVHIWTRLFCIYIIHEHIHRDREMRRWLLSIVYVCVGIVDYEYKHTRIYAHRTCTFTYAMPAAMVLKVINIFSLCTVQTLIHAYMMIHTRTHTTQHSTYICAIHAKSKVNKINFISIYSIINVNLHIHK